LNRQDAYTTATELAPYSRAALVEAYRRVVEIDAALTEATTVDTELRRWCEERLGELLNLLEPDADAATKPEQPASE